MTRWRTYGPHAPARGPPARWPPPAPAGSGRVVLTDGHRPSGGRRRTRPAGEHAGSAWLFLLCVLARPARLVAAGRIACPVHERCSHLARRRGDPGAPSPRWTPVLPG